MQRPTAKTEVTCLNFVQRFAFNLCMIIHMFCSLAEDVDAITRLGVQGS